MWGINCLDYLSESHRILEDGGEMLIIEPKESWPGLTL